MYLCNQTHLIDDITPYVHMKSHPLHAWHRSYFIWYHIHSCCQHTLFVCHGTHSVYDIICIIYDVTHTVCVTTQALYLTWNLLKLPSHPLYMSSHTLSRRYHTYCVRHHRWHMYAIICVIHDIISTLYDNIPYYLWHHMHYIHYITCIIYDISSTLYDVTFTMCVTSHSVSIYDIKHSVFMTYSFIWHHTQCYDHTTIVCRHRHYALHYKQYIIDITHNVQILWKEVNVCHHSLYMYYPICTTYDITSTLYDITPLYDFKSTVSNITSTLSDLTYTVSV